MPPSAVLDIPGYPPLPVVYEDGHGLVLDQPAGWATDGPGAANVAASMGEILRRGVAAGADWARSRELRFLAPVTHLDSGAEGLVLFARTPAALAAYREALADRRALREHLVVIGGKPPRRTWTCCLKLRPDPAAPHRALAHPTRGQHAETRFEVAAHGEGLALLVARPRTDRPFQIRAHLASAGLPVVGDADYGFGREVIHRTRRAHVLADGRLPQVRRSSVEPLALRSARLAFVCPFHREPVEITAPVDDFLARYGFSVDAGEEDGEGEFEDDVEPAGNDTAASGNPPPEAG